MIDALEFNIGMTMEKGGDLSSNGITLGNIVT